MKRAKSTPKGAPERERLTTRRRLLLACFALAGLLVMGRAFQLQALQGEKWARAALEQQRERVPLPARRGAIYDRDSVPLALTHETYRVSIAPRELREPKALRKQLVAVLGLSPAEASRATSQKRRWVVLPGRFTAEQRKRLGDGAGLYFERRLERFYPQGEVAREVIGVVSADGRALGGVEQELDSLLRGEAGYSVLRRDAHGEAQPTISLPVAPPRDGADVYLTIDLDLQEIADGALREAVRSTGAAGGDLLISDPHTGELLAAVSRRQAAGRGLTAVTEPYEPGSVVKPFTAAALLSAGRVRPDDRVFGENGRWTDGRRTITDSHPEGWMTLQDVLRVSSNIGIVKFASRLRPGEQYELLRDFGFGTPTGIEYPAESSGRLRRPGQWSKLSGASLAMGYELTATPLQLTAAYGALANGGVLMEPHLLREVRAPDGTVLRKREPREVRRVVARAITERLTRALVAVVDSGTATQASFADFKVAGKTGTARRTGAEGRYESGAYTATFAGYFPADDPQIVIFVKLDKPQGASYYGGTTAAPVTRETLQGILAARAPAFHGQSLLATRAASPAPRARRPEPEEAAGPDGEGTYVFLLNEELRRAGEGRGDTPVALPALTGLSLRDAVRRAHSLGLQVRLQGSGAVGATHPAAGAPLAPGDTLLLIGTAR